MGVATSFTSARMLDIEQNAIVDGFVDLDGDLILEKKSGVEINAGNVIGPQGLSGETGIPAGTMVVWTADTIPTNWLECNGQAVSRTTYSDLFTIIGIQYGVGDGSTTFNVPDLRSRTPVGQDTRQTEFDTLGKLGGAKDHVLTSSELAAHSHSFKEGSHSIFWGQTNPNNVTFGVSAVASATSGNNLMTSQNFWNQTNSTGNNQPHNNMPPYSVHKYIIKASGGIGELNSTVETVLLDRISEVERKLEPPIVIPIVMDRTRFTTYSERHTIVDFEDYAVIRVVPNGPVILSGLLHLEAVAFGEVIGYIPEEYAPEYKICFPVEQGDVSRSLYLYPDGTLRASTYGVTYLSLDGLSYIPKGVGVWTPPTSFSAHYKERATEEYGPVSCYKDPYGFVWWRGLVEVKATGSVDNTVILNYDPSFGYLSSSEVHLRVTANDGYGCIAATETTIKNKANTPTTVGSWISLANVAVPSADSFTLNEWMNVPWMANGWDNYRSIFPIARYTQRTDNLVFLTGLIRSGTLGYAAFMLPGPNLPPSGAARIFAGASNTGRARIDVGGMFGNSTTTKRVSPMQGGNGWLSLDGIRWMP